MNLVGFSRLGELHDPDSSWIIPSNLTSKQLKEAVELIQKFEFAPPIYDDGKAPEDFLRSKAVAARRATRRVDFDDDSDGIDHDSDQDRGEYAQDDPTARAADGPRKKLTRRKRARTPVELDDEEKDRRAEARRKKDIEKQGKVKSTMFIHDSDDEDWDAEKDAAFFAREQALRDNTMNAFKKSLALGSSEPATKKRKAEDSTQKRKKQKSPPKRRALFADSDDDDDNDDEVESAGSVSSRESSQEREDIVADASEEEASDTPLSSQLIGAAPVDEDTPRKPTTGTDKQDVAMADADEDDEEEIQVVRRPAARNMRAGFIVDSDSE